MSTDGQGQSNMGVRSLRQKRLGVIDVDTMNTALMGKLSVASLRAVIPFRQLP